MPLGTFDAYWKVAVVEQVTFYGPWSLGVVTSVPPAGGHLGTPLVEDSQGPSESILAGLVFKEANKTVPTAAFITNSTKRFQGNQGLALI